MSIRIITAEVTYKLVLRVDPVCNTRPPLSYANGFRMDYETGVNKQTRRTSSACIYVDGRFFAELFIHEIVFTTWCNHKCLQQLTGVIWLYGYLSLPTVIPVSCTCSQRMKIGDRWWVVTSACRRINCTIPITYIMPNRYFKVITFSLGNGALGKSVAVPPSRPPLHWGRI